MPKTLTAPDGGKRFPLSMRTTEALRRRLEEAAKASGRSLAQEVEGRLEQSFKDDDPEVLDLKKVPLLRMLALALKQAELSTSSKWYESSEASTLCRHLMLGVIDLMLPAQQHANALLGVIPRDIIADKLDAVDLATRVIKGEGPEASALIDAVVQRLVDLEQKSVPQARRK